MTKKILIINGPNLNLLGQREESKYGKTSLDEVKKNCERHGKSIDLEIKFEQSNIEGEIVTMIQKAKGVYNGIIINAAGYTHTSVAIRDSLNIFKKGEFSTPRSRRFLSCSTTSMATFIGIANARPSLPPERE